MATGLKSKQDPSFKLLSSKDDDKSTIKDSVRVHSIVVSHSVNSISTAEVFLVDGDASEQKFVVSDAPELQPGKELTVKLGYQQDDVPMFTGIIVMQGIRYKDKGTPLLYVELKHPAVKLTHVRKNGIYAEMTDSDVIKDELVGDIPVEDDGEFKVTHKELVRVNVTDWDFLVTRAEANGKLVYTTLEGGISVKKPEVSSGNSKRTITFGIDVIEMEAEIDARNQYVGVKAYSWDYTQQQALEGAAESLPHITEHGKVLAKDLAGLFADDTYNLYHSGKVDAENELTLWAEARLQKSLLSKIRGRVRIHGDPDVLPGDTVELAGFSEIFNGFAFVSAVRHSYMQGEWLTDLEFGLAPDMFTKTYDVNDVPVSGLMPPGRGLQVGTVKQVTEDPDGQYRVQVSVALLNDTDAVLWARMAAPDAGSERGVFFRPQPDDEVVVGFVNEDPRDAIILGMLFNKDKLPIPFDHAEFLKQGIQTKEKLKLEFDDEKKVIDILTPGGNNIQLNDENKEITLKDANNNSILMSKDGITIKSGKDIIIEATGDIKANGVGMTLAAKGQFKAEGKAGIEVSSTAIAVLKGSVVQIN